jgi:hypothetical protein
MGSPSSILRPDVFSRVPDVAAGFSTRHGGVSAPPYATFNLGRHVGDDESCVEENRRRFCSLLGADPAWLVTAGQVHGATVQVVDAPRHVPFCDGLVTDTPGVLLTIGAADCAAVLLADPEARVVGACHAGWRGATAEIAAATVRAMADRGADAARMRAYVSPCIGLKAFEVGPEVADRFDDAFVHRREGWRRPHVDLKGALRRQLERAGLQADRIEVSPHGTVEDNDLFFSHRADDGTTGRMLGGIHLKT